MLPSVRVCSPSALRWSSACYTVRHVRDFRFFGSGLVGVRWTHQHFQLCSLRDAAQFGARAARTDSEGESGDQGAHNWVVLLPQTSSQGSPYAMLAHSALQFLRVLLQRADSGLHGCDFLPQSILFKLEHMNPRRVCLMVARVPLVDLAQLSPQRFVKGVNFAIDTRNFAPCGLQLRAVTCIVALARTAAARPRRRPGSLSGRAQGGRRHMKGR